MSGRPQQSDVLLRQERIVTADEGAIARYAAAIPALLPSPGRVPHAFPATWLQPDDIFVALEPLKKTAIQRSHVFQYRRPLVPGERYQLRAQAIRTDEASLRYVAEVFEPADRLVLTMTSEISLLGEPIKLRPVPAPRLSAGALSPDFQSPATSAATLLRYADVSHDHNPVHFDRAAAERLGLERCIVHGMMIVGMFETAVQAWRPAATIMASATRFMHPLYADEPLVLSGALIDGHEPGAEKLRLVARGSAGQCLCIADVTAAV